MPSQPSPRRVRIPTIEFLKDRLYLGAFDSTPHDTDSIVHFNVDDSLPYNAFHHDFGPLHIGHLYRFAVALHETLAEEENKSRAVVFYSRTNPRARANAACVLCCYMVLVQSWPPHLALAPIAQAEPPYMPFRDAGYSVADFTLSVQDVVYGVWKAKDRGLLDMREFNLEEYEKYERVEMGDFNTIPPHFVAFASPQYTSSPDATPRKVPAAIRNVLDFFVENNVALVVRLNSPLYDKRIFENRDIQHVDMIFEDGTCPDMDIVRRFIGACVEVTSQDKLIAVHCKAGLGRTGCLIGAFLIYAYSFTASEVISYMRFMRPGMVVGPQQHWLYIHQHDFRDWRHTMVLGAPSAALSGYRPLVPLSTLKEKTASPRTPIRSILGEVENNAALPAPTPGQPRKHSPAQSRSRSVSDAPEERHTEREVDEHMAILNDENAGIDDTEALVVRKTRSTTVSPSGRSVSFSAVTTTTTTTMTTTTVASPGLSTRISSVRPQRRVNSGSIAVEKVRGASGGIRKVSAKSAKRLPY
ncbi:dual specificity protein phosphatase [Lipomyces chichibuensis]|uniref:dual specificity protein phosphatase n=1 Tax=Lipomyces chichibuensis TaxID=1546026 RepID=UPI003344246E